MSCTGADDTEASLTLHIHRSPRPDSILKHAVRDPSQKLVLGCYYRALQLQRAGATAAVGFRSSTTMYLYYTWLFDLLIELPFDLSFRPGRHVATPFPFSCQLGAFAK